MHLHHPGKAGRSMGASRELHILPRTLESLWVHTCPHLPLECVWQFCCPSRSLGHGPLCWAPELPFVPWLSLGAAQCPVLWGWPSWMSWRRSNCRLMQPVWAASWWSSLDSRKPNIPFLGTSGEAKNSSHYLPGAWYGSFIHLVTSTWDGGNFYLHREGTEFEAPIGAVAKMAPGGRWGGEARIKLYSVHTEGSSLSVSSWNCFTTLQGFLQLSASLGGRGVGPGQLSDRGLAETQAEGES